MANRNTSIYDIAKEAGVSTATVSRVINTPDKVNTKTRSKIHAVMERMNYSPNALAQSLVSRSTKTIGVFISNLNNPYYAEMLSVIEKSAFDSHYSILLGNTYSRIDKEEKYVDIFVKKQVDGLIVVGGRNITEEHSRHLIKTAMRMPVVLTNHAVAGKNIYCVLSDEAEGASLAVQHLIDSGREQIAYINGYSFSFPSVVKKGSYLKTLSRNRMTINEDLMINATKDNMEGGYLACEALINKGVPFNAIFVANDLMAIGVMKKLNAEGYKIPQDVSVVGYDDIHLCNYLTPSLSSVSQNISSLGNMAVELLNDVLEEKEVNKITYLQSKLMIRESSRF